ncbi:MAG TPA: hypothetical protein VHX44_19745 [Planctomycetota bacterium]|nr:hypothetical protein [Planctomycetota bacterium]
MTTFGISASSVPPVGIGHLRARRSGFTLFEVSISLVLVSFGVISVLMLLPAGLKAQQMARFQVYAAAKAEEMIEQFNGAQSTSPAIDSEGLAMWDVPVTLKPQSWDLEAKLSAHRFGIMPLPLDIAKRLDSDGTEIREILDAGGYVYYSQPLASTGMQEQGMPTSPPNEAQKMIIGVRGYAQQNALASFPLKNWPYHTPYPSPPLQMHHMADKFLPLRDYGTSTYYNYYSWPWTDIEDQKNGVRPGQGNWSEIYCVPWETSPAQTLVRDPDLQKVYDWPDDTLTVDVPGRDGKAVATKVHWGYFPYACGRLWSSGGTHPTWRTTMNHPAWKNDASTYEPTHLGPNDRGAYPSRDGVKRYVATTLWYALKKALTIAESDGDKNPYLDFTLPESQRWKEVQAFRFLAHATTCMTAWYSYTKSGSDTEDLSTGVEIPQFKQGGTESPDKFKITHKLIKYLHERSLYLINQFAASYPYDWAVPRPLNRVEMMDFPLLQFDLFTPPLPYKMDIATNIPFGGSPARPLYDFNNPMKSTNTWDRIFGRSQIEKPQQWRVVSPEPIRNIGVSATFPTSVINAEMKQGAGGFSGSSHFGNIDHYSLTDRFTADERCRELIFWVVDWQAYEDFETAPSAPVDAGKYPIGAPRCNWHDSWDVADVAGHHQTPTYRNRTFDERIVDMDFVDQQLTTYRNPEKTLLYWVNPSGLATGTDMSAKMVMNDVNPNDGKWGRSLADKGPDVEARRTFAGVYGADRNFNKKLDRGPVPRSVRLRAVEVARFNFYDPRIQTVVR